MSWSRPVWAEVDLSAIGRNMHHIKSLLQPGTRFCAVIKGDGYGHGAIPLATQAIQAGADYLAVAIVDEAIALREGGFTQPILILGWTPPAQARQVAAAHLTQTIFNLEQAQALDRAGQELGLKVKAHIKVDTGMGRLGIRPQDAAAFALALAQMPNIELEGIFTHFAMADSDNKTYTLEQFAAFTQALEAVKNQGVIIPIRHCANSAATLDLPQTHLDMVRTGIILYGLEPSPHTSRPIPLEAAMRFKSRIAMVKDVPAGTCMSYGCTYVTPAPARIATLPVGYADGWTRMLSNKTQVVIRGRRAPVVGTICMDQCLVDVSGVPEVREGDEVLLFGGPDLPVEEVARHLGTINYEIVCMVGKRVPRVYC